jgi:hypothetical protein
LTAGCDEVIVAVTGLFTRAGGMTNPRVPTAGEEPGRTTTFVGG